MRSLPPFSVFSPVLLGDVGVAVVEALGHMPRKHLWDERTHMSSRFFDRLRDDPDKAK